MTKFKVLMTVAMLVSVSAYAKKSADNLEIQDSYIYAPITGATATAGYGLLKNNSQEEMTIEIVKADGFKAVELHETVKQKDMMAMQKVESFKIAKGGTFSLIPGGNHIMLFDPTKKVSAKDKVNVTFKVNGKEVIKSIVVKDRAEVAPKNDGHHH